MTTTVSGSYPAVNSDSDATINGLTVGKGGGSVATTNTAIGVSTLAANTTANGLTAVGYQAGLANTTGVANTFVGATAGKATTTGAENTAIGNEALFTNTTGAQNTVVGRDAMLRNTTGSNNTAFGYSALFENTTASNNTAVGYQAGYSNTTGTDNVAIGANAMQTVTTGSRNTIIGYQAGYTLTSSDNVIIGRAAGFNLTTGGDNTFIGARGTGGGAGYAITTGSKNTIIGQYTGNQGGLDIRTASNRIVLSDGDGNPRIVVNSSGVMFVGANFTDTAGSSQIVTNGPVTVGYPGNSALYRQMYYSSDNNFYFTNGSNQGYLSSAGAWTNASDARLKKDIRDIEYGLNAVISTKPRHYERNDVDGTYIGFVAQELQTVIPEVVSGNPETQLGVDYGSLVAVAFKAIQELNAKVEAQALEIAQLKGN